MPRGRRDMNKPRAKLDKRFWGDLKELLRLSCSEWNSAEGFYFAMLMVLLYLRSYISIPIAKISGYCSKQLVGQNWPLFKKGITAFLLVTIPAAAINAARKYVQEVLSARMRKKLSLHLLDKYLAGSNFYHISQILRMTDVDTRITQDVDLFCTSFTDALAELIKPILDFVLTTWQLKRTLGWQGPLCMYSYFIFSGIAKTKLMPKFGSMAAKTSQLEGEYRTSHIRLVQNCEEVAFSSGARKERLLLNDQLQDIRSHKTRVFKKQAFVDVMDDMVLTSLGQIMGWLTLASPYLIGLAWTKEQSERSITGDFVENARYISNLGMSVADLVVVANKAAELGGYVKRVHEVLRAFEQLDQDGISNFTVSENLTEKREEGARSMDARREESAQFMTEWRRQCQDQAELRFKLRHDPAWVVTDSASGGKSVTSEDVLAFDKVDILSPDGTMLVRQLDIKVNLGDNVMVTGPNGSGKTSIFRVIGDLWPVQCGTVFKPAHENILFVPQRPYLVNGTLRDQIIYPHSPADMEKLGVTDDDLKALLRSVDPADKILSTWDLDTIKDWYLAFSGGQKQRVAMARVYYHRPTLAILDECTSAVSEEIEDTIYENCRDLGITICTVSHRASLKRHHQWLLSLDGRGNWKWEQL